MKYADLAHLFAKRPFFETVEINVLFDEPPEQIQARLSRWVHQDKLIQLRRGKYLLPEQFRQNNPSEYYISNYLYRPSYVSLHSALEFYGLIPESVGVIEAVTTKQTAVWSTEFGRYKYFSIKQDRFWGYSEVQQNKYQEQLKFLCATPEKALLDLFYFQKGKWTKERIRGMRFQNYELLDIDLFLQYAKLMKSPKVIAAVSNMIKIFK